MNILALNFSPKGDYSTSLHFAKYVEAAADDIHLDYVNIGQGIHSYVRKPSNIAKLKDRIDKSDIIMFVYPVYTFAVPCQMVEFIETVKEHSYDDLFKGKYFTQILTSKHFYDSTAIKLTELYANDLGMKILPAYSGDMDDFNTKAGKNMIKSYAKELEFHFNNGYIGQSVVSTQAKLYGNYTYKANSKAKKKTSCNIIILTDAKKEDTSLLSMIDKYVDAVGIECTVVNIHDIKVHGGCLGCLQCMFQGKCKYKDDMFDLIETVYNSDISIHAYKLDNHFTSSEIKCFDDRCFCHGHTTMQMHRPQGYLISGSLSTEPLCEDIYRARADVGRRYLMDIVSDDTDNQTISDKIEHLAAQSLWAIENKPVRSQTFWGVGGMKVFRDLIFRMRYMMKDDHKFYKKNKLYDFPKSPPMYSLLMSFLRLIMKYNKSAKMNQRIKDGMILTYVKAIKKEKKNKEK